MKNKKFLCLVVDTDYRNTLEEYEIEAHDWLFARHKAAQKFKDLLHYTKKHRGLNWEVDSIEIGDE